MQPPECKRVANTFFYECEDNVHIVIERIYDDSQSNIRGEISAIHNNGSGPQLLNRSKVNLTADRSRKEFSNSLKDYLDIDWAELVKYVCNVTVDQLREGQPLKRIGTLPEMREIEYTLDPLIEKGQATTIFAPGGSGKSYLADYIATLVQHGRAGIYNWLPIMGNVLYLDWESCEADHSRRVWAIKQGLSIVSNDTFLYRFCDEPLVNTLEEIQKIVMANEIDLVIVDSQMAASGQGTDAAMLAGQYYNALRTLKCATLTIDHVPKSNDNTSMPYGSVVKWNRARSVWELKGDNEPGESHLDIGLYHRKHNEGLLHRPLGIRLDFDMNGSILEKVELSQIDIKQHTELSVKLKLKDRIIGLLMREPMTVAELCTQLETSEGSMRTTLNKYKTTFIKSGDRWGLSSNDNEA